MLTTSSNFDPIQFLVRVHGESSLLQLKEGLKHLNGQVMARDDIIRELVRQNFTRFVKAKNNVDAVYSDMQQRGLASSEDHGTGMALASIAQAYKQAVDVFEPLVKRTEKEAALKRRIDFLHRYQTSVFSVDRRLREARVAGDFASAVHDWRRGKMVLGEDNRGQHQNDKGEWEALQKFWAGQVEPEAALVRDAIRQQLTGDMAGWAPFEEYNRLMGYLRTLEGVDPFNEWLSDYCARLDKCLVELKERTVESMRKVKAEWVDDFDSDDLEAFMTKSVLRVIQYSSVQTSIARLDFLSISLWIERQGFFTGLAVIIDRCLSTLVDAISHSGASADKIDLFMQAFGQKAVSFCDDVLLIDSGVESVVVALHFGAKAIQTLSDSLSQHALGPLPAAIQKGVEETFCAISKKLVRGAWATISVDCRRVVRWVDWSIDSIDFSTAVMRSLEALVVHSFEQTGYAMQSMHKVLHNAK